MREILKDNFDMEFKNIEKDLRNASFLAIDCEFSGLVVNEKLSCFDKIEDRYYAQQKGMENFSILQMGITAFHFNMVTNTYIPYVYCFNIFPQSFGETDIDFTFKTSSIEFLRQYNFDFNKLLYHGIPYLSHEQEKHVRSSLTSMDFWQVLKRALSIEEKSKIQELCSEISEWIARNKTPSETEKLDGNTESKTQVREQLILTETLNSKVNTSKMKTEGDSNSLNLKNPETNSKLDFSIETQVLESKHDSKLCSESTTEESKNKDLNSDKQLPAHAIGDEVDYNCILSKDNLDMTTKQGRSEDEHQQTFNDKSRCDNERKNQTDPGDPFLSLENPGQFYIKGFSPIQTYITYHEISQRFPQVIVYPENNEMRVEMRKQAAESPPLEKMFEEKVMDSLKGFSRVVDLLIELKKPMIGHNMFSDLIMISKQFRGRLPSNYQGFKKVVHDLFPVVYDTKFLSHELRRRFRKCFKKQKPWRTNSLEGLFVYFQDNTVFCPPNILHCDGPSDEDFASGRYHNAAWDSYCAGYIFIRLVQLLATLTEEKSAVRMFAEYKSSEEQLSIVKQYCNHINIIRGKIGYTVLDSDDPESHTHTNLVVEARRSCKLDMAKVAELFSRHGRVEIKQSGKLRAFISVDRRGTYIGIMRNLRNHPDFEIARYSPLQHNIYIRSALWTLFIASVVGSGYLFYKAVAE